MKISFTAGGGDYSFALRDIIPRLSWGLWGDFKISALSDSSISDAGRCRADGLHKQ